MKKKVVKALKKSGIPERARPLADAADDDGFEWGIVWPLLNGAAPDTSKE
jgi:hypothetical protein